MVDRERMLAKIAELRGYLERLREITPKTFEEYERLEVKQKGV
jgi:hypothetical protein